MPVAGIASEIGCGKSTVAAMFGKLGAKVIDADKIVGELYRKNFFVKTHLVEQFGEGILDSRNRIDRRKLAGIVFASGKELKKLNSIVHPFVFAVIKGRLKSAKTKVIIIDAPLLVESGMKKLAKVVIAVKAKRVVQLLRLEKRGYSLKEARERIDAQLPLREKIKLADYVIDNSGKLSATRTQVKRIYKKLEAGDK